MTGARPIVLALCVFSLVACARGADGHAADEQAPAEQALADLDSLQWDRRIVLVRSAEPAEAIAALSAAKAAVDDRRISWFVLTAEGLHSNHPRPLAPQLGASVKARLPAGDQPACVLIGLDGGTKDSHPTLDLQRIWNLIDAMPMRRAELDAQGRPSDSE